MKEKKVTFKLRIPIKSCIGCYFHESIEERDCGLQCNTEWCNLFHKQLEYIKPIPLNECRRIQDGDVIRVGKAEI